MPSIYHLAKSTVAHNQDHQVSLCGITYPPLMVIDPKRATCPECLRLMTTTTDRPALPPGYYWSPESDLPDLAPPRWRVLGPKVHGPRFEVYASTKSEDTPEGAAKQAWKTWEAYSGLSKQDFELLQSIRKTLEGQPNENLLHLLRSSSTSQSSSTSANQTKPKTKPRKKP